MSSFFESFILLLPNRFNPLMTTVTLHPPPLDAHEQQLYPLMTTATLHPSPIDAYEQQLYEQQNQLYQTMYGRSLPPPPLEYGSIPLYTYEQQNQLHQAIYGRPLPSHTIITERKRGCYYIRYYSTEEWLAMHHIIV